MHIVMNSRIPYNQNLFNNSHPDNQRQLLEYSNEFLSGLEEDYRINDKDQYFSIDWFEQKIWEIWDLFEAHLNFYSQDNSMDFASWELIEALVNLYSIIQLENLIYDIKQFQDQKIKIIDVILRVMMNGTGIGFSINDRVRYQNITTFEEMMKILEEDTNEFPKFEDSHVCPAFWKGIKKWLSKTVDFLHRIQIDKEKAKNQVNNEHN